MKHYIVTITPRTNAENKVKRRCYLTLANSLDEAKKQAVADCSAPRSSYKLEASLFKEEDRKKYIRGIDGDLVEVSENYEKDTTNKPQTTSKEKVGEPKTPKTKNGKKSKYDYETTRSFCLISYIDGEVLENWIASQNWIQHWAMAYHDKDVEEDGTPKPPHTHVLLYTYHDKTSSAIKKRFDKFSNVHYSKRGETPQNTLSQDCKSMSMMWRYLTHMDDPEKYQYPDSIRRCDFLWYWLKLENDFDKICAKENLGYTIVQDLLSGVSTMEMIERYGREFIINRSKYVEAVRVHLSESRMFNDKDIVDICLQSSRFSKDEIYVFWNILEYLQTECLVSFGKDFDLITGEVKVPRLPMSDRI